MTSNNSNLPQDFAVCKIDNHEQLQNAHRLRIKVFVDEQGAPPESEIDAIDADCTHWMLLYLSTKQIIGTIRLVPISQDTCALGRLCLLKEYRGRGLAGLLIAEMEREAWAQQYSTIQVHAQTVRVPFYLRAGYQLLDLPEFIEDLIPHKHMTKTRTADIQ